MTMDTNTVLIVIALLTWALGYVRNDWKLSSIGLMLLVVIGL